MSPQRDGIAQVPRPPQRSELPFQNREAVLNYIIHRRGSRKRTSFYCRVSSKPFFQMRRISVFRFAQSLVHRAKERRKPSFSSLFWILSSFLSVVRRFLHRKLHGHVFCAGIRFDRCQHFAYGAVRPSGCHLPRIVGLPLTQQEKKRFA